MKHIRIAALTTISLAAALSLTACSNGDSANDSSSNQSSASSTSSPASSSDGASKSDGGATSAGGSGSGSGAQASNAKSDSGKDTAAGANSATNTGSKVTFCKTKDLSISAVNAAPDKTEGRIDITMTNHGSTTCSATGFAGVDIKDVDHTSSPIERGTAQPRVTILKPGDAAVFDLAYTIDSSGNSVTTPTNILVTPPNETHTVTLKWPAGAGDIKGAYTDVQVYPTHTTK
jgi:hypothetical protein